MSGYRNVQFTVDDMSHKVALKKVKGEGFMGLFAQEIFDIWWYDRHEAPKTVHLRLTALEGQAMQIVSCTEGVVIEKSDEETTRSLKGSRGRSYILRFVDCTDDSDEPIRATVRLVT